MGQDVVENHGNEASGTRGRMETLSPSAGARVRVRNLPSPWGVMCDCTAWTGSGWSISLCQPARKARSNRRQGKSTASG